MGFEDEGFKEFEQTKGQVSMGKGEEEQVGEYASKNFINASNTIGYAEVSMGGIPSFMFFSRIPSGEIITIPGEGTGPVPLEFEGVKLLNVVKDGSALETVYDEHMKAIEGLEAISDEALVKEGVLRFPQRAVDLILKVFEMVVAELEDPEGGFFEGIDGVFTDVKLRRDCPGCGEMVDVTEERCPHCDKELEKTR